MLLKLVLSAALLVALCAVTSAQKCGKCDEIPICCSSASGDWGWEKNGEVSCIVPGGSAMGDHCSSGAKHGEGDCGVCGPYPLCCNTNTGSWGYENRAHSCIVRGSNEFKKRGCSGGSSGHNDGNNNGGGQCPSVSCPPNSECGVEKISGLKNRMLKLKKLGAGIAFLASAMMETDKMTTNYAKCDGSDKYNGSCNAGYVKQNWYMTRLCNPAWRKNGRGSNVCKLNWRQGWGEEGWQKVLVLNQNTKLDIQIYNRCRQKFSKYQFFAGHRWGQSGFCKKGYERQDILKFIKGYDWTVAQLKKHGLSDCRFWVNIHRV